MQFLTPVILTWSIYTSLRLYTSIFYYLRYIHLCVIVQLSDFFTGNIYTSVPLYSSVIFSPEVYTPLSDYTFLWFFYLKYIHLCVIKQLCDSFFTLSIYTSVRLYISLIFSLKYIHLCAIKDLCDIFTWIIYTSVRLYISLIFLPEVYTPLCDITPLYFFSPEVYTPLWDYTPLWTFHLMRLQTSVIFVTYR